MTPDLIQTGNQLLARTPDAFEEAMRPVGDARVSEVLGRQFSAEIQLFKLPRTAFFELKLPNARVVVPDGSGFVGVNMVTEGELCNVTPTRRSRWKAGTAHVVNHENYEYDFSGDEQLAVRALCFQQPLLRDYARKFHGHDNARLDQVTAVSILDTNAGECFLRFASFVWEELTRNGVFLQSSLAAEEIEDSLWALLLSALQHDGRENRPPRSGGYAAYAKSAEEFILAHLDSPLRVTDIAEAVDVSVPTLNRAFRKFHGMGPKTFVKQRRLDRVRSELQNADPQVTSVTEIATKYAFWHLSQFAADYKKAFLENPSETLHRS